MSTKTFQFYPISSGSCGNATYVGYGSTHFLIDCGLSGRYIENALKRINVTPASLSFILLTHSHKDHTCGIGVMARRYKIPVYATKGTWEIIEENASQIQPGKMPDGTKRSFTSDVPDIPELPKDMEIYAFSTPHDARDSVGYRISCDKCTAAFATDLGYIPLHVKAALLGSDIVLLESNHDIQMLKGGRYPEAMKKRILGNNGHLSNNQAGIFAGELVASGTKTLYLGHLSHENNTPDLAYNTVRNELKRKDVNPDKDLELLIALRAIPSRPTLRT